MNHPRFSIVTITRNDCSGLTATHASVAAQLSASASFEWIVIDGGSVDGTVEYLQRLHDPNHVLDDELNLQWTSESDRGLYDAMNKGLDRAAGDYIIFMNSGDRFAGPEVLYRIDRLLRQDGRESDLVFGDAYEEDADGRLFFKPARAARTIGYGMFTHHQAMLYARRAVVGMRYNLRYAVAADYDFTCRLLGRGGTSLRLGVAISVNQRAGLSEKRADIGRRENSAIQKTVLHLGPVRRAANYATVAASGLMRTHLRSLYDYIRFRRVIRATGTQVKSHY